MLIRRLLAGAIVASTVALALPASGAAVAQPSASPDRTPQAAAKVYKNCKALNAKYPHGVGRKGARDHVSSGTPVTTFKVNNALYTANKRLDRDKDGVACEKR
jgi:hypothetical protein